MNWNLWIGLIIIILLIVIIVLVVEESDEDHESPYHWHSLNSDTYALNTTYGPHYRISLGPQTVSQTPVSVSTGFTGANEFYLMPMDGTMNSWAAKINLAFDDVPTGLFPMTVALKAVKIGCTGAGHEHTLIEPIEVTDNTQQISVCETFRMPIKFKKLDNFAVVLDIAAQDEVQQSPVVQLPAGGVVRVAAVAEWCGCTSDTDCCSGSCSSC